MMSVPQRFQQWSGRTPQAIAVTSQSLTVTYAELDAWSDALAWRLAAEGVRRGGHVIVCVERSCELVVALLGVLKAGAAYVPIDADEPGRRAADVVADAEATVAVCDAASAAAFKAIGLTVIDVPPLGPALVPQATLPEVGAHDLAYLMYTSGSTGRPKAVMVEHRNIINLVTEPNYVTLGPDDRLLHLAPVAFDAATFEIWGALLNGGRVVIAPPGQVQADELGDLVRDNDITVLWLTTALFHRQVDVEPGALAGLRVVLTGGDVLSVPHVRALRAELPGLQVINCYGPTETTTFTSSYPIPLGQELTGPVPIGKALQNVSMHIVDAEGHPLPDGEAGELWIGGAGVSRGYWRRPELTAEKFVEAGWVGAQGTYYRSGDLARKRPDGVVEFVGRVDDQFKLRGFRIEPGEIESVLTEHPHVREVAVALRENHLGDRRLVAWVVPAVAAPDRQALRDFARDRLPGYMVPAAFVEVTKLPLTRSGKIDRKSLPAPDWRSRSIYV